MLFRIAILLTFAAAVLCAQDNYEIQVYGSETQPAHSLMLEAHTNFTFQGSKTVEDGVRPTNHALHETIELTQGFNDWFETGFYLFTAYRAADGYNFVGTHIRPRVRVPESWHWKVGVSLSTELGYVRQAYSADPWSWEIRPIVDKELGRWYLCLNPTLERALHGVSVHKGLVFAPNAKIAYSFTKKITGGLEYYGSTGSLHGFDAIRDQEHAIMPALDLNLDPNWECNIAVGVGMTGATDHLLVKMIVGRRFNFTHRRR